VCVCSVSVLWVWQVLVCWEAGRHHAVQHGQRQVCRASRRTAAATKRSAHTRRWRHVVVMTTTVLMTETSLESVSPWWTRRSSDRVNSRADKVSKFWNCWVPKVWHGRTFSHSHVAYIHWPLMTWACPLQKWVCRHLDVPLTAVLTIQWQSEGGAGGIRPWWHFVVAAFQTKQSNNPWDGTYWLLEFWKLVFKFWQVCVCIEMSKHIYKISTEQPCALQYSLGVSFHMITSTINHKHDACSEWSHPKPGGVVTWTFAVGATKHHTATATITFEYLAGHIHQVAALTV